MIHNKKVGFLGLLTVMLLLSTTVQATYVPTFLPESSFWQGRTTYVVNGINAIVEYAVYDTASADYSHAFDGVGTGRYVYAYQAFNVNFNSSAQPIATFELLNSSPSVANGVGSLDDGKGGIKPSNDDSSFIWKFKNADPKFVANEQSAFMVFSTNAAPKVGSLQLTTQDNGDQTPTPKVPEPATLAMLAAGAVGLMRKRKARV